MKLTKQQRAELKMKFGGHCAYCGCELGDKWHADHIEAVKREIEHIGGGVLRTTGEMTRPHLDTIENMNPACVPCNSNKSSMSLKSWRSLLTHYRDVQLLRDSTHARHLHRFGLIEIKPEPVVFFFEKWGGNKAQHNEVKQEPKWTTIKVVCQKCGHYLNGCHCNHFGDQCPHLNTSMFGDDGLAECFNCNKIINKDREVVGDVDDQHLTR